MEHIRAIEVRLTLIIGGRGTLIKETWKSRILATSRAVYVLWCLINNYNLVIKIKIKNLNNGKCLKYDVNVLSSFFAEHETKNIPQWLGNLS